MAQPATQAAEQPDNKRERSTIEFPYLDLDDALEIVKAVHTVSGNVCQKDQLAAQLNQSATSGAFNLRLTTAKMFGLLSYERGTITLTNLGKQAADTRNEKAARVNAFLNIPLYKAVYDEYKGRTLPPVTALETEMVRLGVAPKQKDRARQVFQRSAKQAGFFAFQPDRLVEPPTSGKLETLKEEGARGNAKPEFQARNEVLHPAIEGLLKTLPAAQTQWPAESRKKWLQAAENILDLIYLD